jgi:hypothetical protein
VTTPEIIPLVWGAAWLPSFFFVGVGLTHQMRPRPISCTPCAFHNSSSYHVNLSDLR